MNFALKYFFFVGLYFFGIWYLPWGVWSKGLPLSLIYLWDLSFALSPFLFSNRFSRKKIKLDGFRDLLEYGRMLVLGLLAFIIVKFTGWMEYKMPFAFVSKLELKVLVLAPILEELVFRKAFFWPLIKKNWDKRVILVLTSTLFSLSHLGAYFILPEAYKGFILLQVGYTFLLGIVIGHSFLRHQSILWCILHHFIFNLVFYLSL